MSIDRAIYTDMLPIITIENGMAFLEVNAAGHAVCTPVHHFEVFLRKAEQIMARWHVRNANVVVPLCELCKRHDLPRD